MHCVTLSLPLSHTLSLPSDDPVIILKSKERRGREEERSGEDSEGNARHKGTGKGKDRGGGRGEE